LIFNKIFQFARTSRAGLAKELGISKPTVASNVEKLIAIGLVQEKHDGTTTKSGGRKPVMLVPNKNRFLIGALDLSFVNPVCAVANLDHEVIGEKRIELPEDASPENCQAAVKQAFLDIISEANESSEKLVMIVISQPGIIKGESSQSFSFQKHHRWTQIGLVEYLDYQLNVKTTIKNDVNLAALGEMHYSDRSNLLYVSCGRGFGAGIILNHQLYEGAGYAAGEIGSVMMRSGQRLEEYIAIEGLIKKIEPHFPNQCVNFENILKWAKENHPLVEQVIYETGRELGRILYNCCTVLDINTVIFGGDYLELGDTLFKGIEDKLDEMPLFKPQVLPSDLRQDAGVYGCFVIGRELIINQLIDTKS